MEMRLRINTNKDGSKNYYVLESYRTDSGKSTTRIVKKLGTYEQLLKEHDDPEAWANELVQEMNKQAEAKKQDVLVRLSPSTQIKGDVSYLYNGGYLFLQKLFYELRMDYICTKISQKYNFSYNLKEILAHLVYGRILEPASKSSTYDYAKTLLEAPGYERDDIYRALEVIGKEKDYIQAELYKFSSKGNKRNDKVLYYDCTNYYFEIEQEKGIRKYGPSKEHRPNPIVEMGMFMDGDGIPLAFCIHEGNTNEQKTLCPLEKQIMTDFGHAKFIVCTDAGLSSVANRRFNDREDRAFITAQSIKKMKAFQRDWALSPEGWHLPGTKDVFNLDQILESEELCEKYRLWTFYKEEWFCENDIDQKYIVTFSLKYRSYQRNIRNEQIARAQRALLSPKASERTRQTDYKRFIRRIPVTDSGEVAEKTVYSLNEERIRDEERYDGFYAVATNLDDKPEDIIKINRGRWEIEECFRIMKHEFKARPVYLQRDARITAHFTTCFLALVVFRYLEKKLSHRFTCSQIVHGLRDMKFYKLGTDPSGFLPAYTRTEFTDTLHDAFGFRTDYEIISRSDMNRLINSTKKR
jgi:transposase, IS4 family